MRKTKTRTFRSAWVLTISVYFDIYNFNSIISIEVFRNWDKNKINQLGRATHWMDQYSNKLVLSFFSIWGPFKALEKKQRDTDMNSILLGTGFTMWVSQVHKAFPNETRLNLNTILLIMNQRKWMELQKKQGMF